MGMHGIPQHDYCVEVHFQSNAVSVSTLGRILEVCKVDSTFWSGEMIFLDRDLDGDELNDLCDKIGHIVAEQRCCDEDVPLVRVCATWTCAPERDRYGEGDR